MSYILGALKKAEKERRRDRSLDLNDWDQETWENPVAGQSTQSKLLWLVFLTLLILLGLISWLAFQVLKDSGSSPAFVSEAAVPQQQTLVQPLEPQKIDVSSSDVVPVHIQDQDFSQLEQPGQAAVIEKLPTTEPLPEFSGHIYFAGNAALSRVFSDSESYREGDNVQGYVVEAILETEVLLSRAGQQYQVSLTN